MPAAFRGGVASRCCCLEPLPVISIFPMILLGASPCGQRLLDGALPQRISLRAVSSQWRFATALPVSSPRRPASIFPMALRHGDASHKALCHSAPASNKPHPAEKSTPVWLAIWHIWAGFANSQLQCATFHSTYSYKCTFSLLPTRNRCSDIANPSAHLHRLPTPPPYLRRMRLPPGRWRRSLVYDEAVAWPGCRCWMQDEAAAWPGCRCWMLDMAVAWPVAAFLQITARANPCSRHLWGTLARAVASI